MTRLRHDVTGFTADPETGLVYGKRGLPLTCGKDGYLRLFYGPNSEKKSSFAHRIVWEVVNGPIPDGMTINHINGVKNDNRIANLELATRAENTRHAYANGLINNEGHRSPRAVMTDEKVMEMRILHAKGGIRYTEIGQMYGIHATTASEIIRGKLWKYLPHGERIAAYLAANGGAK